MQPIYTPIYLRIKLKKMRKVIILLVVSFLSTASFAQARLTTTEFAKNAQPAVEIDIPFAPKTVESAIEDKMQKSGSKGKEIKGFIVYRTVSLTDFKNVPYDLYFKTERKSRKEKENSIVTLMVSPGLEKFIGDTTNAAVIEQAKLFLSNLMPSIQAADLELQINDQDEASKKAEKKYNNLVEDGIDLVKKKEKLENDIAENIKKQADQKADMEKQKQILTTLKGKRKQ